MRRYQINVTRTNENTNGLIRDFFPEKTDFTAVSLEELQEVEYLLNTRPRKRLGWLTPLEAFSKELNPFNIISAKKGLCLLGGSTSPLLEDSVLGVWIFSGFQDAVLGQKSGKNINWAPGCGRFLILLK